MTNGLHLDINSLNEFQALTSKKQLTVLYQSQIQTNQHLKEIKKMIQAHDEVFKNAKYQNKYHNWLIYTWLTLLSGAIGIKTYFGL